MKKSILIFSSVFITLIIITSVTLINNYNEIPLSKNIANNAPTKEKTKQDVFTDFVYDVGTRFGPIKKSDIDNARTINDFIRAENTDKIINIKSVSVVIIEKDKETNVLKTGNTKALTTAQLKLLKSSNHNTNILVRVDFMQKNNQTGMIEANYDSPYLTIVPEIEAEYINGKEVLLNYLRANGKKVVSDANVIAKKTKTS